MSGIWALVPVKSLADGKSRLSPRLTLAERQDLSLAMLRDVLSAVSEAPSLTGGVVIYTDAIVGYLTSELGMTAVAESAQAGDLNGALRQGLGHLRDIGADAALILPADVPLVEAGVIERFIASSSDEPGITICPSLDGGGTNALLLRPVTTICPTFGPRSFQKHVEQARLAGQTITVTQLPQLELDIDEPPDLDRFLSVESPTRASTMLRGLVSR